MKPLNAMELGYLAGVIDSEGSIMLSATRSKSSPSGYFITAKIKIETSSLELIAWLKSKIENGYVQIARRRYRNHLGKKTMYQFYIFGRKNLIEVLTDVIPLLVIKREHAEAVLQYCKIREARGKRPKYNDEDFVLVNKVRKLNAIRTNEIVPKWRE